MPKADDIGMTTARRTEEQAKRVANLAMNIEKVDNVRALGIALSLGE